MAGIGYTDPGGGRNASLGGSFGWGGATGSTGPGSGVVQAMLGSGNASQAESNPFYGNPNSANYKAWEAAHGGGGASRGGGGTPSSPATVNNVAANPISSAAIDKLNARAADPTMGVGAYDLGIQKIRANASRGIAADMASQAARGVAGTGITEADARGRAQNQEAQVGSLTANFLAQREDKRDQLIGQAGNMGLAQGAQQQGQQQINYGQYNADRDAAWRETQAQTNNLQNILSILSTSGLLSGNSLGV